MTGIVGSGVQNGANVSVLSLLISSMASTTRGVLSHSLFCHGGHGIRVNEFCRRLYTCGA